MRFGGGKYSHERYHNTYALLMAMGTVEGLKEAMPSLRTFVLSRAGSPGIQRYAANWMGDNMSRWDHLWLSTPMGNGLGLSGQAFVGADIGGFGEDSNPELFARWIQHGALSPFARNHNMVNQIDQYAFSFGDQVLEVAREAIALRYKLMPYIYSQFALSAESGAPVQRSLVFDYQYEKAVANLDDQYLFGQSLLVAPVYVPGAVEREVYFPAGEWLDWHTGQSVVSAHGSTLRVAAPLERIPLYVKAGAVIPTWTDNPQTTMGYQPQELELQVWVPGQDAVVESVLHEDDGLTLDSSDSKYLKTLLKLERKGSSLRISGTVVGRGCPEFARTSLRLTFEGQNAANLAPVVLANDGQDFEIQIELEG
jgi:alpha-glucosidase